MTLAGGSAVVDAARGRPGGDPIFALHQEASRRAAEGEPILNATLGVLAMEDGRLAVLPSVLEAFARAQDSSAAGYAPVAGHPDFTAAIVGDVFGDGPLAAQAVAVATPGGTGAVYQAVVNFLEPGQKLLTTHLHWGPYPTIASNAGRGCETFPMFRADQSFDVEALGAALDRHVHAQGRALVVLNDPCHNPTGYSLSRDEWRRMGEVIRRAAKRAPVTVLLDVAYFRFGGAASTSWIQAIPGLLKSATVLVAWTASKTFTQYGARVGALLALHPDAEERNEIENALAFTSRATWSSCNHLGQRAITALLTDRDLRRRSLEERDQLVALLQARIGAFHAGAEAAGLRTSHHGRGFFTIVFTPDAEETAAKMRDVGVFVLPIPGAVRIALCSTPLEEMPRLLKALEKGTRR